ncbi:MAG: threonylcarbamoyl-AMP synthase [Candidatus Atribacteria bacterium]|nr:threonylcarbamoyl-AMP synthase [Candidatus Atribacteria bacterium]
MEIVPASLENIRLGAEILKRGGLVAFPTETVYGLGAVSFFPEAVARIFEVKGRPRFDPLIVHIASQEMAFSLWQRVDSRVEILMKKFWPGPLTLVLPKKEVVPDIVTAGLPTVAVRMPAHPVALSLIRMVDLPIAAPSANRFGRVSPTSAEAVKKDLGNRVDLILDGGKCELGIESTVLLMEEGRFFLLRPGALSVEELEAVVGKVEMVSSSRRILSPGMTRKHYAPSLPLYLFEGEVREFPLSEFGNFAVLAPFPICEQGENVFVLSQKGDLKEAASHLFALLRELEKSSFQGIIALPVEEKGLGRAIMDRLKRAASGLVKVEQGKVVFIDK